VSPTSETYESPKSRRAMRKAKKGTVREGLPYGGPVRERPLLQAGRAVGRVVVYAVLVVALFALSVALGGGIAIALDYLIGWPDTWWP
jgi:hypothetical protein